MRGARAAPAERSEQEAQRRAGLPARVAFPVGLPGRQVRPVLLAPVAPVGRLVHRGPAGLPGRLARPVLLAAVAPGRLARPVLLAPVVEPVRGARAAPAERSEQEAQRRAVLPARVAFPVGLDLGSPLQAVLAAEPVRQEWAAEREAAGLAAEPAAQDRAAQAEARVALAQSADDRTATASGLWSASPGCSVCEEGARRVGATADDLVTPLLIAGTSVAGSALCTGSAARTGDAAGRPRTVYIVCARATARTSDSIRCRVRGYGRAARANSIARRGAGVARASNGIGAAVLTTADDVGSGGVAVDGSTAGVFAASYLAASAGTLDWPVAGVAGTRDGAAPG